MVSIIAIAIAAAAGVAGCSAARAAQHGSESAPDRRADLPVDAQTKQAAVCAAYGKAYGIPAAFRPTHRPVPSLVPVARFGPAAASCATTAATGVTMRGLVWSKPISGSDIESYARQLQQAGFVGDPSATAGVRNGPRSFAYGYRPPASYQPQAHGEWAVRIVIVGYDGSSGLTDIFLD